MLSNPRRKGRQFQPNFLEYMEWREKMNKKILNRHLPSDEEELNRLFPPADPQPTSIKSYKEEK